MTADNTDDLTPVADLGRISAAGSGRYVIPAVGGLATVVLTVSGRDQAAIREFHSDGKVTATAALIDAAEIGDDKVERLSLDVRAAAPIDAEAPRVFSVDVVIDAELRGRVVRVDWVIDPSVNNSNDPQDTWTSANTNPAGTIKVTSAGKVTCTGVGTISAASGTRNISGKPITVAWAVVAGNTSPVNYTVTGGGYYELA